MSILIISFRNDSHARAIAWGLNTAEIKTSIVDTSTFPTNNIFTFAPVLANKAAIQLTACNHQNETVALETIRAVWCRRLVSNPTYFDFAGVHEDDLNDSANEVRAFIDNWWSIVHVALGAGVPWLNPIEALANAKNKAYQLKVAHAVGFCVPATIMGNSPRDARAFCTKHGGEIIMKPFYPRSWREQNVEYHQPTYLINSKHLQDDMAIQLCPAIYQEKIEKAFELRVLVLGSTIIAAKLDSQKHEHSQVDWRMDAYKRTMAIEPYVLSEEIKSKILLFMAKMNLKFGSVDLIVTPNSEVVFLEINEQGQFLFLEKQNPKIQVMRAVCQFLTKEAGLETNKNWANFSDYIGSADELLLRAQLAEIGDTHITSPIKYTFQ